MEDQVKRTLGLLTSNPTSLDVEDAQLLIEFTSQYCLFYNNFTFGITNGTHHSIEEQLSKSVTYLKKLGQSSSQQLSTSPIEEEEEPSNGIVTALIDGKRSYFMDGEQIHFKVWKNKPKNGDFRTRWNRNYVQLKQFKERWGHLHVTRSTTGHEELGNWVAEQRRKLKRGKITQSQFETLTELGFEWDRSHYFHKTFQKKKKAQADK